MQQKKETDGEDNAPFAAWTRRRESILGTDHRADYSQRGRFVNAGSSSGGSARERALTSFEMTMRIAVIPSVARNLLNVKGAVFG